MRAGATTGSRSWRWIRRRPTRCVSAGNDYIAGGPGADTIFGELGNDTIQGDSSIDYVAHRYVPIGAVQPVAAYATSANCTAGGHPGTTTVGDRVGACIDPTNALLIDPSVSRASDSGDYIEGGGGNNVIFGDGGQNNIIGGSSDFFGTSLPSQRTSGSNQIFSGSGTELDQEDPGDTSPQGHDANSTVIVGNNGEIISLVGTNGIYENAAGGVVVGATGFLQYNYDGYTNGLLLAQQSHIIVRGVTLLDNTPGGPDLAGQLGPLVQGAKATNGVGDIGGIPLPCNETAAQQINQPCQQQGNEIHVESGDAFVYGGPGNDVIYGGGQDDSIILSYGDNWVSGGRGDQCIIGGGGRCLVSRNSSSYGEPLYGIAAIPAASLNQLIANSNGAQEAIIYVEGAIMYTAELLPVQLGSDHLGLPGRLQQRPHLLHGLQGASVLRALPAELRPQHHLRRLGQRHDPRRPGPVGDLRGRRAGVRVHRQLRDGRLAGEHGADRDRLLPPVQPGQRDGLQPACRRPSTAMLRGPPARRSSTTSTRPTRGARSCSPRPAPTASGPRARARPAPAACRGSSTSTRRRSACRSTRSGTRARGSAGARHRRRRHLRRHRQRLDRRRHGPGAGLRRLGQRRDRPAREPHRRRRSQRRPVRSSRQALDGTRPSARPPGRAWPTAAPARTSSSPGPPATA